MTYYELYKMAIKTIGIDETTVDDYRPAVPLLISELAKPIPNAIVIWFKDGSKVIYIHNEKPMGIGSIRT